MNSFSKYVFALMLLSLIYSCNKHKSVNKRELINYLKDENKGLDKKVNSANVIYEVTYRPIDLIVEQELRINPLADIDSLKNVHIDCLYFTLAMSQDSLEIFGRKSDNFSEMLKTISFQLGENIYLMDNDTKNVYYLKDFIYPRLYGSTSFTSVLLCFKDKGLSTENDLTLIVKDFINDSPENLQFNFLRKDLNNIPKLKITHS